VAQTTLTTVDPILKEVYETQLQDQLQSEIITLKRIEKTSEGVTEEVGGKYVTFPIRVKRNQGIGARNESEALPTARTQGYAAARVKLTYQYGSIELTGQTFELADRNFQAFASTMQEEMDGIKETLRKDANRQVYGTAVGKMATANAAGTTTTFVCSNGQAIYLEVGQIVDIYSSADALKNTAAEILTVVKDNPSAGTTTVTFVAAVTATASGDYLVRTANLSKELIGFGAIANNSGTLYNVDPTVNTVWKAEVDDPGSLRSLSEGLMTAMVDRIRTNGGRTTVIFTSLGVRRSYFNLLAQQRRYTNTQQFEGGFSGLAFTTDTGDIPVVADYDCPQNNMFFMNEKALKVYQTHDWEWMNRDGSMWQRVIGVSGTYFDAYNAILYKYYQLGTHRRNSHGVMKNITEG
jgi:hypothetical protein